MASLAERCGYTHEDLAKRLGKSRTSITESLALAEMPDEVRNLCRLADISSKSLLLQVVRQQTPQKMIALIEQLTRDGAGGVTREQARKAVAAKPSKPGRPKAFVFQYRPPTKTFNLRLQFRKSDVDRTEVIAALERIIAELRKERVTRFTRGSGVQSTQVPGGKNTQGSAKSGRQALRSPWRPGRSSPGRQDARSPGRPGHPSPDRRTTTQEVLKLRARLEVLSDQAPSRLARARDFERRAQDLECSRPRTSSAETQDFERCPGPGPRVPFRPSTSTSQHNMSYQTLPIWPRKHAPVEGLRNPDRPGSRPGSRLHAAKSACYRVTRMRVLDRYMIRETIAPFLLALAVFTFVLAVDPMLSPGRGAAGQGRAGPDRRVAAVDLAAAGPRRDDPDGVPDRAADGARPDVRRPRVGGPAGVRRQPGPAPAPGPRPGCARRGPGPLRHGQAASRTATSPSVNTTWKLLTQQSEADIKPQVFFERFPGFVMYVERQPAGRRLEGRVPRRDGHGTRQDRDADRDARRTRHAADRPGRKARPAHPAPGHAVLARRKRVARLQHVAPGPGVDCHQPGVGLRRRPASAGACPRCASRT